ncbi:MAG TPA: hypothetical protein VFI21_14065 [Nocardioides sp.]|jgi:hypothetical protein|nr:hypothetical protein [Nocardioides sp.]
MTLLSGAVLTVASILVIVLSDGLGLEVESVALMGAASGAVLALVPMRSPQARLGGFLVGLAASWLSYLVRAGFLPDTTAGHAIAVAFVVVLCTVVAAGSRDRIPLWSTLLGAAVLAGSYETTYIEAPSQVLSTSTSSSTGVLLAVAFGFFAAALVAPRGMTPEAPLAEREPTRSPDAGRGPADGDDVADDAPGKKVKEGAR